jgi:hypothetical protein
VDGGCFELFDLESGLLRKVRATLARVSIKGARWRSMPLSALEAAPEEVISQETLIEFVRNAPSLQWFRSHLTPENVAMLRGERPWIQFSS